tara:strand:+ start:130 stop:321 length:192 start_codon:yes stop_codon:yes gene_type:complete
MERVKKEMVERTYLLDRGVMVTVKGEDITEPQTWDVSILDINTSAVEELEGVHAYRVSEILNS